MAPISTTTDLAFTPPGLEGEVKPVYYYRVATLRQREEFRVKVATEIGDLPTAAEIRRHAEAGIAELVDDPEERAALTPLLDRIEAGEALDQVDLDRWSTVDAALRALWPQYAAAQMRRMRWNAVAPRIAAQLLLTGWQDVPDALPYRRTFGQVPDEVIASLSAYDLAAVGSHLIGTMFVARADAKKPASPSGSAGDVTSSTTSSETSSAAPTAGDG